MTIQQRIEQVLEQNIPILNDDVEALRKVCKVVWVEDRELNDFDLTSQYFFADPRNPSQWLAFNEHENSHLAIPASKFFEVEGEKPSSFYDYDKRGVRAFVRYATSSGKWAIECYRKKRKDESKGELDWQMVREGHIQVYGSREEAEQKALELAEQVCIENCY